MEAMREALQCAARGKHPGAARRDDGLMAAFLPGPSEPNGEPPQWSSPSRPGGTGAEEEFFHDVLARDSVGGATPPGVGVPGGSWADAQWDRGSVSVLTALGFAELHVRSALTAHSGSLDLAMAYLCAEELDLLPDEDEQDDGVGVYAPQVGGVGQAEGDVLSGGKSAVGGLFDCAEQPAKGKDAAYRKLEEPESAKAARAVVLRGCAARPAREAEQQPEPQRPRSPVMPVVLAPPSPPPAIVDDGTGGGLRGGAAADRSAQLLDGIDRVPRATDPSFGWSNDHPDYVGEPASPPHLTN